MTGISSSVDRRWLALAVDLSRRCPPSTAAFSVGAVIVDSQGVEISRGYSRETGPHDHAEEAALGKIGEADLPRLAGATMYTSLEPCTMRRSKPRPCTQLILDAGIPRVVLAWREPSLLVDDCRGVETLATAGVEVVEIDEMAEQVQAINAHLPKQDF